MRSFSVEPLTPVTAFSLSGQPLPELRDVFGGNLCALGEVPTFSAWLRELSTQTDKLSPADIIFTCIRPPTENKGKSLWEKIGKILRGIGHLGSVLWGFLRNVMAKRTEECSGGFQWENEYYDVVENVAELVPKRANSEKFTQLVSAASTRKWGLAGGGLEFTLEEAKAAGILFTGEEERQCQNRKVVPFFIPYDPLQASTYDVIECEENLVGSVSEKFTDYDEEYRRISKVIRDHNEEAAKNGGDIWAPVFVGLSKGGMAAHAMGAKYRRMSIAFNPFGIGEGVRRNFIGIANCKLADYGESKSHLSLITAGDWVSDPRSIGSSLTTAAIFRPTLGRRVVLPCKLDLPESGRKARAFRIHNDVEQNFSRFLGEGQPNATDA
jgi:hypothetical protein